MTSGTVGTGHVIKKEDFEAFMKMPSGRGRLEELKKVEQDMLTMKDRFQDELEMAKESQDKALELSATNQLKMLFLKHQWVKKQLEKGAES